MPSETVASLLVWGRESLDQAGIDTAALDARLLLQHVTGLDHGALIGRPEMEVSAETAARFRQLIRRRGRHEPVSRITGVREFYGRNFRLSAATLDPRPDTETLISVALDLLRSRPAPRILDLGTGTGAIAITLLAELPGAQAVATDISSEALETAAFNAQKNGVSGQIRLAQTSWFDGIDSCFDLIISNPPYLAAGEIEILAPEVKDGDPRAALDGGADGLGCYRKIAEGVGRALVPLGHIVLEIGAGQADQVTEIFGDRGFELVGAHRDLGGHVRCLVFGYRKIGVGNARDLGYIRSR